MNEQRLYEAMDRHPVTEADDYAGLKKWADQTQMAVARQVQVLARKQGGAPQDIMMILTRLDATLGELVQKLGGIKAGDR